MFNLLHMMLVGFFLFTGAFFMLVAAIGVFRLPDLYLRMAATSKAATLGAACVLVALAIYFLEWDIAARAVAAVLFLYITAPIAAHMLGRAAYVNGCPLWEKTVLDELRGRYNTQSHMLTSTSPRTLPPPWSVQQIDAQGTAPEPEPAQPYQRRWWEWWA